MEDPKEDCLPDDGKAGAAGAQRCEHETAEPHFFVQSGAQGDEGVSRDQRRCDGYSAADEDEQHGH